MSDTESGTVRVHGLRIHYVCAGRGSPIVLLHGWPTSSFLWRNVMPHLARTHRVIALDLPGFGRSDKPLDASYSFRFFDSILDGAFEALGIDRLGLVVHDLGGPIGLHWASLHPERVERLALLNTVVYPQLSWAVLAFVLATRVPGIRSVLASPWGLEKAVHLGVHDRTRLRSDAVSGVRAPFADAASRRALLRVGSSLHPKGFEDIVRWLPTIRVPVLGLYGAKDRILPDIARTMRRLAADVPGSRIEALDACGHFLQEECPDEVGARLAAFFDERPTSATDVGRRLA